jgi:hypothetical protein
MHGTEELRTETPTPQEATRGRSSHRGTVKTARSLFNQSHTHRLLIKAR